MVARRTVTTLGGVTNSENVAETEQAVSRGTLAGINDYPYVGFLESNDGTNIAPCSGILITPAWVLTANHCINYWHYGSGCVLFTDPETHPLGEESDCFFHLVHDPAGPAGSDATRIFRHQSAIGGPVRTMLGTSLDTCSANDVSLDLALIRLDRRVPLNLVSPKHPPSGRCTVDPLFQGTMIGYGPRGIPFASNDNLRNFTTSAGWTLAPQQVGGDLYTNGWVITPNPIDPWFWYFGPFPGDSGGALIDATTGNLCGVVSRAYAAPVFGLPGAVADMAAVDSNAAKQFINAVIMDPAGNFLGECSTGPMSLRDADTDNDLIPDACDPCPDVPEPTVDGVFLPIVDFDHDGVPDACDICPTIPNPRNILTHEQDDEDNDGIGNQCDLCPHSDDIVGDKKVDDVVCCANDGDCGFGKCFPAAATSIRFGHCAAMGGRCEGSVDLDFDLIGESCDPCPGTFSPTFSDMDGDGIGDACDNCPGSPSAMHSEDLNDECDPADPLACKGAFPAGSVCVPPHVWNGTTSTPRCTLIEDTDEDGVGNRCDNCDGPKNPFEGIGMQPNCNIHAEAKLGVPYPYFGDACDPNPCAELDVFTPPFCDPLGSCPAPAGGQWAKLAYSTNLLPETHGGFPNPVKGAAPLATVGVRHCNCETLLNANDELTVEECDQATACPIQPSLYNAAGNWSTVQLVPSIDGPDAIPPASVATFLSSAEYSPLRVVDPSDPIPPFQVTVGFGDPGMFTDWANWFIPGLILNTPKQTELWSHVVNVTNADVSPLFYQDEANHYEIGRFGLGLQTPPSGAYVILDPARWLDGPACPVCPQIPDVPNWGYDPSNGQIVVEGAIQVIDMTIRMPSLFGTLVGTIVDWVPVAESSGWVLMDAPRLAALSPDGTSVVGVFAPRNDRFVDIISTTTTPLLPNAAGATPPARSGFGSVLSAVDNALYVIGGFINATTPANDLWRFDVFSRQWLQVPFNGPAPQRVLAATFRPEDRNLYIVDERKIGNGNMKRARLLRIDVGKRESTILADVPRQPHMNQVFLSHSPKGELLLVGSSSTTGRYVATRLAPQPNGTLLINKGFDGKGTIVREPTLTPRGVTLPLALPNGKVKNTFRYADDLHPGAFHPIGSCL